MLQDQPLAIAAKWAKNPYFDENSRREIQDLLDQNNVQEIIERFYKDIEFGTGGLRSPIGMGRNRINIYTIRKATQALASTVKKYFPQNPEWKVAISYDSRRFSKIFAQEAACVLAGNGIHSYVFKTLNPTPILSFSVRYHKAQAGIMITASHNPPNYNGYKVYWQDGAQVIAPYDVEIIAAYNQLEHFDHIQYMDLEKAQAAGLMHWVGEEVENAYHQTIRKWALNPKLCQERGQELKVIYTPLHGTGLIPCARAVKDLGPIEFIPVKEQAQPDENFSTVKYPNPEDPKALVMGVELMQKEKGDILLGTDPDSDRLGIVVNHQGEAHFLNGNQIGVLLLHYVLSQLKEQNRLPTRPYAVKSIVTSELQTKIAQHFGAKMYQTLTGFKWICSIMRRAEEENWGEQFVFATEESFGYLPHSEARDKDAVSSVALASEMALYYKTRGKTLVEALDGIYQEFGFFHETLLSLDYEGREGQEKIKRIMETFRQWPEAHLDGQKILELEDYALPEKLNKTTGARTPLDIPKSNVLGLTLEGGDKVYLRPSGTEPKIKFYIMVQVNSGTLEQKKLKAQEKCQGLEQFLRKVAKEA